MITVSNAEKIAEQLEEFAKVVERKLENVVKEVAVNIVQAGVKATPLGDARAFITLYELRQKSLGLQPIEGIAQGSWEIALDGSLNFVPRYGQGSGAEAIATASKDIQGYHLGANFKIGNAAPYIELLENNYSPQTFGRGIAAPIKEQIQAITEADIKAYYDRG